MSMVFIDPQGSQMQLSAGVFKADFRGPLVHQVVTSYQTCARSGTKAQKSRGEVAGSTRKLWRQKGTGRARVGAASNPIWRSGGVTFAAKPRFFAPKTNRKMYRGAMRSILSQLLREERIKVVESFDLPDFKTKSLKRLLEASGLHKALLVDLEVSQLLELASRNLSQVLAVNIQQVSPVDLIRFPCTVMTRGAIQRLEELLSC